MSDDTSDDTVSSRSQTLRSRKPMSLSTPKRAARWETFALLVVLLILVFVFA
jgi:hypothetical protein